MIRRIVAGAPSRLTSSGVLLIEIGQGQGEAVAMCSAAGLAASLQRDLGGVDRVVEAVRA